MPSILQHQSSQTTKLLFIGDSGSGKTGALASLADAGYNLRIVDLDNGLDILKNLFSDPKSPYQASSAERVVYETITDKMRFVAGRPVPDKATVWDRTMKLLEGWKVTDPSTHDANGKPAVVADLGAVWSWTAQDILVIDALTFLCQAAMNKILALNGRLGGATQQADWYSAQNLVEGFIQTLYDENLKCNVIVNCHVTYIGEDNGPQRGYPMTLGKALSPKLGRYFNTILLAQSKGFGANAKRVIVTKTVPMLELKNTKPLSIPAEYDLATGLADYFRDIRKAG